jgi:two-component system nitrogen regulation response regulator NtrX
MAAAPRVRVLVVDDENSTLMLIAQSLDSERFSLTVARNGEEGLQKFTEATFDIVISDRDMSLLTCNDLAVAIKELSPAIPIVLISGNAGAEVNTTLFSGFLPKPFTLTQLVSTVCDALPPCPSDTPGAPPRTDRHGADAN